MNASHNLQESSPARNRLLGAVVGGAAIAVLALFGLIHPMPGPASGGISAGSGAVTKFPPYSSPVVGAMKMGATTTTRPSDEPTALATSKAVPAIKAG